MFCPSPCLSIPSGIERVQGAPDAGRTRGWHAKKSATGTPEHRHSLRNGLRLIRTLPGVPGLLASVALDRTTRTEGRHRHIKDLTPASGGQDHAISLVRSCIAR